MFVCKNVLGLVLANKEKDREMKELGFAFIVPSDCLLYFIALHLGVFFFSFFEGNRSCNL